jgi:outer membrane lipoprotein LolB
MTPLKATDYLLLASLLLSACSQQPTKTPNHIKQSIVAIPEDWNITAKLGVRSSDDSGSVTLQWQQRQANYHIRISGPLGQGSGVLSGNPEFITITQANKDPIYSTDPTDLIANAFGWAFPLDHLNYWVRGIASPLLAAGESTLNPSGTLATLTQSDWSLDYSRYKPSGPWLMPHRIRASNNDVVLTLVIRQWAFPNTSPSTSP